MATKFKKRKWPTKKGKKGSSSRRRRGSRSSNSIALLEGARQKERQRIAAATKKRIQEIEEKGLTLEQLAANFERGYEQRQKTKRRH